MVRNRYAALQKANGKSVGSDNALLVGSDGTRTRERYRVKGRGKRGRRSRGGGTATAATVATTTAAAAILEPVEPQQSSREPVTCSTQ